jgi:hypothetical protein
MICPFTNFLIEVDPGLGSDGKLIPSCRYGCGEFSRRGLAFGVRNQLPVSRRLQTFCEEVGIIGATEHNSVCMDHIPGRAHDSTSFSITIDHRRVWFPKERLFSVAFVTPRACLSFVPAP